MTDQTKISTNEKRRMRPWQRWLMVMSLGLNLLVLGIVTGAFLDDDGPVRGPRFDLSPDGITRALPDELRRDLIGRMHDRGILAPSNRDALRSDMERLTGLLEAEVLDMDAINAVLDRQRGRMDAFQSGAQEAFLEILAEMSVEERRDFVAVIREKSERQGPPPNGSERRPEPDQ